MSFASILGKIAPELEAGLALVGGPFGAVGAIALKGVASVVCPGTANASTADVQAALAGATPDQLLALQKLNDDFKLQTQQLRIDVLQLQQQQDATDAADRNSARTNFGVIKFIPQMVMSALLLCAYFGIQVAVMAGAVHVPDSFLDTFKSMTDKLNDLLFIIFTFWFGSTHGSQKKDDALATAALTD